MAFFGRLGNLLKHAVNRQIISSEIRSSPSFFQATRSIMKPASAPTSKLFVGGISSTTTDRHLDDAFSKYGDVYWARVIHREVDGKPRAFGLVTFTAVEEATRALQALNGQVLQGRRLRINYTENRNSYMDGHFYDPPCSCNVCEFFDNLFTSPDGYPNSSAGGCHGGSRKNYGNFGDAGSVVSHETFGYFGEPGSVGSHETFAGFASGGNAGFTRSVFHGNESNDRDSSGGTTCIGNNSDGGHDGTWGLEHGRA